MKIVVVGMGYVGLSNSMLLAQHNKVIGVDISQERVEALNARISPIIDNEIIPYEHISYNKTTYWKATEYNELLIKREKEWFHNHCIPKINKFWEDVLHYRTKPTEEVMDLVKVNKRKTAPENSLDNFIKTNTKESLFLSDSD